MPNGSHTASAHRTQKNLFSNSKRCTSVCSVIWYWLINYGYDQVKWARIGLECVYSHSSYKVTLDLLNCDYKIQKLQMKSIKPNIKICIIRMSWYTFHKLVTAPYIDDYFDIQTGEDHTLEAFLLWPVLVNLPVSVSTFLENGVFESSLASFLCEVWIKDFQQTPACCASSPPVILIGCLCQSR